MMIVGQRPDARGALKALVALLLRGEYDYADEKVCQAQIAEHFGLYGVCFDREYRLGDGFVDFFFPRSGVALEIKASKRMGKMAVYRQLERYCSHDEVRGILLATGTSQGLPDTINGRPALVFPLGLTRL